VRGWPERARLSLVLVAALTLTAPAAAGAQPASGDVAAGPEAARVDSVFADVDGTREPGCAVGVRRDGRVVLARGYGMANLEHGVPIGPSTVFRIGSVSKQFTAAAVHLAAREGELSLDDPVRRWLPDLPERDPPATVRHLLHHTSGIRDYLGLMALSGKRERDYYTDGEVLEMLARQRGSNFPAGSEHLYSNSGYFLLGKVVRAASGRSLRAFARERIFEPLGMASSHFHDDPDHPVPGRAIGYTPRENGGWRISVTTLPMVGDGGVFTSVEDFLRWDANFERPVVGGPDFAERMTEPGVLAGGDTLDYAMGLAVDRHRGLERVAHGGAFVGYRAGMVRYPGQRFSAVVLCNRSDARPMDRLERMAGIYLADAMESGDDGAGPAEEAEADPADAAAEADAASQAAPADDDDGADGGRRVGIGDPDAYVGRYESPELDAVYRIEARDDALRLVVGNRLDGELEPAGEGVFERGSLQLRFDAAVDGSAPGFVLDAGRVRGIRFERVDAP
jgi:CubicO group peptidase (beta-lactamase class C family)